MIKSIIIDDEPLAIKLLASYIDRIDHVETVATFTNPLDALAYLQQHNVDIIFLDIQMPQLSGVQFAKVIGDKSKIIFTTAYPKYAVEGFELKAMDYLVKPVTFERFLQAVNRYAEAATSEAPTDSSDFVFVKTEYRHQKINYADILFLKGMGDYCAVVLSDKKVMTLENMKSFEQKLPTKKFLRVHRSYIVSLAKIEYIEKNRIVIADERIPVGASYEQRFKEVLGL